VVISIKKRDPFLVSKSTIFATVVCLHFEFSDSTGFVKKGTERGGPLILGRFSTTKSHEAVESSHPLDSEQQ